MRDLDYWTERARWASAFGYPGKEAYARRKIKQLRAIESDDTPTLVHPTLEMEG